MELTAALERPNFSARPRLNRAQGVLIGSECRSCGRRSWPSRTVCQSCGSADISDLSLPTSGRLLTFSTVWVPRPGIEAPYVLSQIELSDGVRLFSHLRRMAEPVNGTAVRLVVARDEDAVPSFWFEPA